MQFVGRSQTVRGQSVDSPWTVREQLVGVNNPWAVYGLAMHSPVQSVVWPWGGVHGQSAGSPGGAHGAPVDSSWTAHG